MKKAIDCLFIGHNEMDFPEYHENIKKMGVNSGAYRDLSLNFIWYDNKPCSFPDIFNRYYYGDDESKDSNKPLHLGETFSAAIAYLGTYLNRSGFTFDYVNSFRDRKAELLEKLLKEDILTIAIITTLYVSVLPIIEIIGFIKKYNRTAKIIVGGPFVSTQIRNQKPKEWNFLFNHTIGADFYVNSPQGETTLVQIIRSLKNNFPLGQINNLYYKLNGRCVSTLPLREDNRLSENMVDWSLFTDRAGEYVNIRTSISCPYSCAFCGFPERAGKYQAADLDAVAEELKQLNKIKTVKNVRFIDDTFNVPPDRFKEILRMMLKSKFDFKWQSFFRCQFADREMVELMKESGCEGVHLGIESGNRQILDNMNKFVDIEKYLSGISLLKELGIVTFGNFIIGFPGETPETVQDTVDFIERSELDFFRTQLWYYEHITPIWRQRDNYNIKGGSFEWSHATMNSKMACDLIEKIFFTVKKSVWVPQYNFDFDSLWHLKHRGMSLEQLKNLLMSFNSGVKEKLTHPAAKEVRYEIIKSLEYYCRINNNSNPSSTGEKIVAPKNNWELDEKFNFT